MHSRYVDCPPIGHSCYHQSANGGPGLTPFQAIAWQARELFNPAITSEEWMASLPKNIKREVKRNNERIMQGKMDVNDDNVCAGRYRQSNAGIENNAKIKRNFRINSNARINGSERQSCFASEYHPHPEAQCYQLDINQTDILKGRIAQKYLDINHGL